MLLGDFVGGGAVVIARQTVLQSAYSREVEAAADRYGVDLMNRAGGDARALGAILTRIAGAIASGPRSCAIIPTRKRASPRSRYGASVLAAATAAGAAEWAALKCICGAAGSYGAPLFPRRPDFAAGDLGAARSHCLRWRRRFCPS